jgi:hypothetical protein
MSRFVIYVVTSGLNYAKPHSDRLMNVKLLMDKGLTFYTRHRQLLKIKYFLIPDKFRELTDHRATRGQIWLL